jgi:RiboL-PSP-HEPN
MPSNALQLLDERLEDVSRLMEARQTGRRLRLDAINRGAIVLLSAQLQGYLIDLFREASYHILETNPQGKVFRSHKVFVDEALRSFRNPGPDSVKSLFRYLGVRDVMEDLQLGTMTNQAVRANLKSFIELRNAVAHGQRPNVTEEEVESWAVFVKQFAQRIEYSIYEYIQLQTGALPW